MHSTHINTHVRGSGRGCVSEWQLTGRGMRGGGIYTSGGITVRAIHVAKSNACPLGSTVVSGCGHPRCLTCPSLNPSNSFTSSISGRAYKVLGTQALTCRALST